MGDKNQQKQIFIVDAELGPFKSIQEAVDSANPGSIIRVAPGLYSDNIVIRKPGIKIEPKEKLGDIILVVSTKPAITIEIDKNEKCHITGLKISHSGNNDDVDKFDQMMDGGDVAQNLFGRMNDNLHQNNTPDNELVNKFEIEPNMNCIILLNTGKLVLEDCLLSLNFIVKSHKNVIPALVLNESSELIMYRCEIKGNKNHDTIGMIIKWADCLITESKIHNHIMGGILIWSHVQNKIIIQNSNVLFNGKSGIHLVGADSAVVLENNKIWNNNGPGVKIGISNKSRLLNNEIKLNQVGIECISCSSFIFNNKIDKNYSDGIQTKCFEFFRQDTVIKNNMISGNKENGIFCTGPENYTKIESNSFIGYNKKAGIKADDQANIVILKNLICKNLAQGILLVESSQAIIEKNQIYENIKANIAFGGQNSVNTVIVDNKIYGGRCEGIFVIEGGEGWIFKNNIYENNDGIVIMISVPYIAKNHINLNKGNGIMVLKDSRPKLIGNKIDENDGIGLFIRDNSRGEAKQNIIENNEIEIVVEKRSLELLNIVQDNQIIGDIRIPQNISCNIF